MPVYKKVDKYKQIKKERVTLQPMQPPSAINQTEGAFKVTAHPAHSGAVSGFHGLSVECTLTSRQSNNLPTYRAPTQYGPNLFYTTQNSYISNVDGAANTDNRKRKLPSPNNPPSKRHEDPFDLEQRQRPTPNAGPALNVPTGVNGYGKGSTDPSLWSQQYAGCRSPYRRESDPATQNLRSMGQQPMYQHPSSQGSQASTSNVQAAEQQQCTLATCPCRFKEMIREENRRFGEKIERLLKDWALMIAESSKEMITTAFRQGITDLELRMNKLQDSLDTTKQDAATLFIELESFGASLKEKKESLEGYER